MNIISTLCFTGHRPQRLGGFDEENPVAVWVKEQLRHWIFTAYQHNQTRHFIAGGAQGVDTWAAEIVLEMRGKDPSVKLTIAVPCRNQEARWTREAQIRYRDILGKADEVHLVHDGPYNSWCMGKRDEWMVDHSNGVIAVWDGDATGGTYKTVKYAQKVKHPIFVMDPKVKRAFKLAA